ncbi:MAG: hypothetical protein ACR2M3_09270 [Thermomicrobiales bacterium]
MHLADRESSATVPYWIRRTRDRVSVSLAGLRIALGWPAAAMLVFGCLILLGAYQIERPFAVKVGGIHSTPFVENFHARETDPEGTHYRWTHATSFLIFSGVGGGRSRVVTLNVRTGRPANVTKPVTVLVNGVTVDHLVVGPDWHAFRITVQGAATAGHGLAVELRTPAEKLSESDPRVVGVQVNEVRVETTGNGWTIPAWGTLGQALLLITTLYFIVFWALRVAIRVQAHRQSIAALGGAIGGAILAWLFIAERPYIAAYTSALLIVLLCAFAALLLPRPLMWAVERFGLAMTDSEAVALCTILAIGICFKLGGLFYPGTIVSDLAWHSKWERTLLHGDFAALYFPSELSSGPSVWGAGILIPKSPLYYVFMAPFTLLPFTVETTLKLVAGLLELTMIFFLYAFLKRIGRGTEGVVAALLYTVTPLSYLILSYGSYPTVFALFLTVLAFMLALASWDRLGRPVRFGGFVLLLTLSVLAYPVIAVFNVLVVIAVGCWYWRDADTRAERRQALLLPLGALIASALAFVFYYVQYVGVTVQSVHTLTSDTAKDRGYLNGGLLGAPRHIATWAVNNIRVGNMLVLLVVAIAGMMIVRRASPQEDARRTWQFLFVWLLILPVFTLVDAYIDMVLKQLFYTMLPVAAFGSITIVWLWRRGRGGQVIAILCCTAITAQAWLLWFHRIAYGGHSGPT